MAKRSKIKIMGDILLLILRKETGIKPTHIMYKANLAHTQMKSYINELLEKKLIEISKKGNHQYYTITENGEKFLKKIREMEEFERTFGL